MLIGFRVLNWLALAFFGFAIVVLALSYPSSAIPGGLNLLPYGSALIAMRPGTQHWFGWVALAFNALWSILLLGVAVVVLLGFGGSLVAVPFVLVFSVPCILTVIVLWRGLRAGSNHSFEADGSAASQLQR